MASWLVVPRRLLRATERSQGVADGASKAAIRLSAEFRTAVRAEEHVPGIQRSTVNSRGRPVATGNTRGAKHRIDADARTARARIINCHQLCNRRQPPIAVVREAPANCHPVA